MDLSGLNTPQREAVEHGDGPLLVFAGAGSGKTRVLTYRLAHLIDSGRARPDQIIAVTFTNKAAGEMKRRVADLLGGEARGVWVHTFHSACLRILRREAEHIGLDRGFVIYDDGDQRSLLKQVIKRVDRSGQLGVAAARSRIELAKRQRIAPGDAEGGPIFREVYRKYQGGLRASNAVDFTDLLAHTVQLLQDVPDVLDRYRQRFRYLLVDEFQDTDALQFDIVKMLAAPRNNLCVVGDDDQSIYSFRGADVGNIRGFEQAYPGARVLRLEQNYRSTTAILDAATQVVNAGGGGHEPKQLWTDRSRGESPSILQARDEPDEAQRVVWAIQKEIARGTAPEAVAVLFRTNAQSRPLEEAFGRSGIPFVLVGGTRFYERREIKEALAYLRLLVQPADRASFARAVRAPSRGIGPGTLAKLDSVATAEASSPEQAAREVIRQRLVGPAMARKLGGFCDLLAELRDEVEGLTVVDLVQRVIERSGLQAAYEGEGTHEGQQRLENLTELVRSAAEQSAGTGLEALRSFMDRAALIADVDDLPDDQGTDSSGPNGRVSLMTIHCAKGLEFGVVCLVGLDDGLFPNGRAAATQSGLEEEYRLCYVACTRAMDRLYLFRAGRRLMSYSRGGMGWQQTRPSPFLRFLRTATAPTVRPQPPAPPADDSVVVYDPDEVPLRPGVRVQHPAFGIGEVRRVLGRGGNLKVEIFFPRAGMKKISARHTRLEIIGR